MTTGLYLPPIKERHSLVAKVERDKLREQHPHGEVIKVHRHCVSCGDTANKFYKHDVYHDGMNYDSECYCAPCIDHFITEAENHTFSGDLWQWCQ